MFRFVLSQRVCSCLLCYIVHYLIDILIVLDATIARVTHGAPAAVEVVGSIRHGGEIQGISIIPTSRATEAITTCTYHVVDDHIGVDSAE